jgi:hypothetical protein
VRKTFAWLPVLNLTAKQHYAKFISNQWDCSKQWRQNQQTSISAYHPPLDTAGHVSNGCDGQFRVFWSQSQNQLEEKEFALLANQLYTHIHAHNISPTKDPRQSIAVAM